MTSWLVDAYLAIGRVDDARELFTGLVASAGRTGLLSEEIDPATSRSLGNHPQAYSHLGLIHNALNLACDLPIPRLLALQSRASAMISVDTGPAHTAAAVGCPVLVLFGIADPVRIAPRSRDVPVRHLVGKTAGGPSILAITVEQVLEAWQDLPKR